MYKINDYVIYKREVCIIKEKKDIRTQEYYILENKEDASLKVSVPVSQESQLLRPLTEKNLIFKVLDNIPNIKELDVNERNLEDQYKLLLQGSSLEDLVKIIKTTYIRNSIRKNNKKKMSDKDIHYQEIAEKFLYNEIAYSLGIPYEEAKEVVTERLKATE